MHVIHAKRVACTKNRMIHRSQHGHRDLEWTPLIHIVDSACRLYNVDLYVD